MVEVTISLAAAEDVIFETARTYGGPLPNGLINSITLALSKLPPAGANNAALQSELDAAKAEIERLRGVMKRAADIVDRNLGRQDEKVADASYVLRQALGDSHV